MPTRNSRWMELLLVSVICCIAAAFRLPQMSLRPMHTDEAVHAVKFGDLLEKHSYRYDPHEYHGPTLNYATLIPAWIRGEHRLADLDEWTLRLVTVFFGLLLIPFFLWLRDALGWPATLFAMFFAAVSPAMIFYSRYYIQEMLLICFTLGLIGVGHRYFVTRKVRWIILMGLFIGLMHATKETVVIIWWTIGMASLIALFWQANQYPAGCWPLPKPRLMHFELAFLIAGCTSALFYSSFGANPHGIADSFTTYTTYLGRAGASTVHIHPWYAYLRWFLAFHLPGQPFWTEGVIFLLGVGGLFATFRRKPQETVNIHVLRFIAIYTLTLTLIYSLIPYKTPWTFLTAWLGWLLLAGIGTDYLLRTFHQKAERAIVILFLILGSLYLFYQAWQLNDRWMDSPANPYVYAQPGQDVKQIANRVKAVALAQPQGLATHIDVISRGGDYWPLPWYFRTFTRVGWWDHVPMESPAAPIILVTPQFENDLIEKLYETPPPGQRPLYLPLFKKMMELRPGFEILGYARKDILDDVP